MPEIRYSDGSLRKGETLKPAELPALDLDGVDLAFIRIDHQTRLQFGETEIVIGTPFSLTAAGGDERTLDPEDRTALGALLELYPGALVSSATDASLTLRLSFGSGATIRVPQDLNYESWQVVGPGSRLIVCPPAGTGTLSVWR